MYLAYHGLLPQHPLPQIYLVFGAGNSGGTATSDAQVLGLELVCRSGISTDEYRRYMRTMFAHETAHSWQPQADESGVADLLLFAALREGTPDYLAGPVTGTTPSPEREDSARPREPAAGQSLYRWFAHYVARAQDKPQAIRELLELRDPQAILTASGYQERMEAD